MNIPQKWESANDWDSHRQVLWLALEMLPTGDVVEFGCGEGSTNLLFEKCKGRLGEFRSYDTNLTWAIKYPGTELVEDYFKIEIGNNCEILFTDSAPGEDRKFLIQKHSNDARVIIVHDTEPGAEYVYGMSPILSTFKYRLDYRPEGKPHTTIVSNFLNVSEWQNHLNSM